MGTTPPPQQWAEGPLCCRGGGGLAQYMVTKLDDKTGEKTSTLFFVENGGQGWDLSECLLFFI